MPTQPGKRIISILFAVILLALLSPAVYAGANPDADPAETQYDEYEDFFEIIAAIKETGEHPHFIEANAARYEAYQARYPNVPFDRIIAFVNINMDKGFYEDIQTIEDPDNINVLQNKNYMLPSGWEPSDLVNIGGGQMMREEAAAHFNLMRDDMRAAGLRVNVIIVYRSFSTQQNTYGNAVSRYGKDTADRNWARPGHSEHQLALSADILHKAMDGSMSNSGFQHTSEFKWLCENAHNYGFILRYPEAYKEFHGYVFEPWHWRYIGVEAASRMFEEGIALYEEYYGKYLIYEVFERVRAYIQEQQEIAEREAAEEAARIAAEEEAAAEAERAAAAAAEAEEVQVDTEEPVVEVIEATPTIQDDIETAEPESSAESAHLIVGSIGTGVCVINFVMLVAKRKKRRRS